MGGIELEALPQVEGNDGIVTIRKHDNCCGWNGISYRYIEPGVPHEVFNMSDTEAVVAVVARSSADEWDRIIPYDRNSG